MSTAASATPLVGVGLYSVSEAARLTRIPARRIRRWVEGYAWGAAGARRSGPVVESQLAAIDGSIGLGFRDLMEVRFVDAFRRVGVSWPVLRIAHQRAAELFETAHPFNTKRFLSDGRRIFAEVGRESGERALLDLADNQWALRKVITPFLHGMEFGNGGVVRWWPLGERRQVVLDPERVFGQPIVHREGVPTIVLARAAQVEKSIEIVAGWFEVDRKAVRDAVDFESQLAA